ncbi:MULTISPECIES: hypothetical protein [Pectobacterium]|uniref:Uncharacterized protein n=2 Tax=Pectobacterium TaxID=122277 RepID=A0AA93DMN1_9GAMM|nr:MULTISPECIES: hypothetical protein [Pectobacterium]KGA40856.1 hypothetical protein KU75_14300 [Pectobacterium odoriferum]MCL6395558.1 hypothetical protein [Pectobacterium carotovorum subsp. carotovorum]RRN95440.1 hypothetical protein DMB83_020355 [Pectobacterium aquaticum]RRO19829.1 hypothetical protein DMB84_010715 [Pectobacterium aquaticum]
MGYIIKRGILVTLDTYERFIEDVHSIPFLGKDGRQSPSYYLDIQKVLQHLICNDFLYAKETPIDDPWTKYSPISSDLGKKKLRFVFEQSRNLCCERALELLKDAGIIDIKAHCFEKHKCRTFSLSKAYLKRWFEVSPQEYKQRDDRYIYLSTGKRQRDNKIITEEQLIHKALSHCDKPRHATRHVSRDTHNYVRQVYASMGGLRINLDKLQAYVPENEREALQKSHFLQHLAERGCKMVSSVPLVVEYFPEYKLAGRGTRSFEKNGGFQAMKAVIKWAVVDGINYDIKSSQLTIIRHELERYGISCKRLRKITKKKIMSRFNVDDKTAKLFIYTLIYSLGEFRKHQDSNAFKTLCEIYGYEQAVVKADEWIEFVRPVKRALNQLVDCYLAKHVNCPGRGWAIRNAVRQTYMVKPKKISVAVRRRILSHMIQGVESKAVYEAILANPGVCGSIEHDGIVSSKPIKWKHSYLELIRKH